MCIRKKLRTTTESTISNEHYQITSVFDKVAVPRFGAEYVFHLEDAIDDCPEYLVHWPTLCRLAEVAGLRCILRMGFHDWFYDRVAEHEGRDVRFFVFSQIYVGYGTLDTDLLIAFFGLDSWYTG